MEFVGHDVCANGNCPAMSKYALMEHWPAFVTARDIASFVGFLNFYSCYTPCFEQRIASLRNLTKLDMEAVLTDALTPEHESEKRDMIDANTSNPCLAQFDCKKRPYILTGFSKKGFGWVSLQADSNHPKSIAAILREMAGGDCEFLLPKTTLRLRTAGFGSCITRG